MGPLALSTPAWLALLAASVAATAGVALWLLGRVRRRIAELSEKAKSAQALAYAGSLAGGPHTLKTDFGNIRLALPEKPALTLALKTAFGQIKSTFPITTSGELKDDHWQGAINGGGASLTARTSSGDVSLEILNP